MDKKNNWRLVVASLALGLVAVIVAVAASRMRASAFVGPTQTVGVGSGAISVDGSGNVGIGTTVPSSTLHVVGTIQQTSVKSSLVAADANGRFVATSSAGGGASQWTTNGSTIYYNGGYVGIGTSTPSYPLTVSNAANAQVQAIGTAAAGYTQFMLTGTGREFHLGVGNASETLYGVANKFFLYDTASDSMRMVLNGAGNVGIGTTAPGAKLDIFGGLSTTYLKFSAAGNTNFGSFSTDGASSPTFTIANPSSAASITLNPDGNSYFSSVNAKLGIGNTAPGAKLSFPDMTGSSNADGITWYSPAPTQYGIYRTAGAWTSPYTQLALSWQTGIVIDGGSAYPKSGVVLSPSGGTVTIGAGAGKLTVGTVDPAYTIGGEKFATYVPGMTGQNEETTGNVALNKTTAGSWQAVIDFNSLQKGSDLWLFAQTTNLKKQIGDMAVLLTPNFEGNVWYHVDPVAMTLTLNGKPTGNDTDPSISYRLSAPRFDSAKWPNTRTDDAPGLIIKN